MKVILAWLIIMVGPDGGLETHFYQDEISSYSECVQAEAKLRLNLEERLAKQAIIGYSTLCDYE